MVKTVTYQGKELPYRLSYYAISQWQAETKKGIEALDDIATDLSLVEPLFFHALVAGHKASNKTLDVPREEMPFILDECFFDFISGIGDFFTEGLIGKVMEAQPQKISPKKQERKKAFGK